MLIPNGKIDIQKARLTAEAEKTNLAGTDNRTQAEIDAANKALCEAGGGKYENGACTPDKSTEIAAVNLANAKNLFAALVDEQNNGNGTTGGASVTSSGVALANVTQGTDDGNIELRDSSISTTPPITIPEDKKTTVAALSGWTGKRYFKAEPVGTDDGTFEAHVYTKGSESSEGDPFNEEYDLGEGANTTPNIFEGNEASFVTEDGDGVKRIASSSFDQTAGVKVFDAGSQSSLTFSGSYHGVSGTYTCTPTSTGKCAVNKVSGGFQLGITTTLSNVFAGNDAQWTFTPGNPAAKVQNAGGDPLASFGWWVHQPSEDAEWSAGVFTQDRTTSGAPVAPTGLNDALDSGTATYKGHAVGKYALYSTTGGTNDAGHFIADATLTATWRAGTADTLAGTIENFKGSDNEARPWEVTLKSAPISDGGVIDLDAVGTVWEIDDSKAVDSGNWDAQLWNTSTASGGVEPDRIPGVVTGTFHTLYNDDGKMIGAFGADQQP